MARRSARRRGVSFFRGVSSISAGSMRSGVIPTWRSNSDRRGLALASTRSGRPTRTPRLLEAVGDTALGQVVGGHLDQHLVAGQHADAVLVFLVCGVGVDLVVVFELFVVCGVGL